MTTYAWECDEEERGACLNKKMAEAQKFAPKPNGAGEMFQLFRDGETHTRAGLTALTGQSRSTIAARLEMLTTLGLIGPAGEANSTGGRPPAVFAFTPAVKLVLAIDQGVTHMGIAVTDLAANRSEEHTSELQSRGHLVCRLL